MHQALVTLAASYSRDAIEELTTDRGMITGDAYGTPVVGPTGYCNLFLNTGHGTLGWTMSCGSGRLLADIVSGRTPEISTDGLTIDRYRAVWEGGNQFATAECFNTLDGGLTTYRT